MEGMPMKKGQRVFAVLSANKEEINVIGKGIYEGDFPCDKLMGMENPRIKLDEGGHVWGCECWWGSESEYDGMVGGRKVNKVNLADHIADFGERK